jgi:CRP/FNR family transcriptional regulator, transcriptional activator FtrB
VSDLIAALRGIPVFAELDDGMLARVSSIGTLARVPPGTRLFSQGDRPTSLHILLAGQVSLTGVAPDGTKAVVEVLKPVDMFILAAVLTDAPYLMSAETVDEARLMLIAAEELRLLIEHDPKLAMRMLASVSMQFRMLVRQVKDLKLRSAAQRLGCFLLALGGDRKDGGSVVLPYDKRLLAARLGTTPEHLSRAFATLRAHGVEVRGMEVEMTDLAKLVAFAGPDSI